MYAPAPGEPWILCLGCELVLATSGAGPPPAAAHAAEAHLVGAAGQGASRQRPGLHRGGLHPCICRPNSPSGADDHSLWARTDPLHNSWVGVRDLATAGLWPLALSVLFASIIVPVFKLAGLTWFLIATRLHSSQLLRERTALYPLDRLHRGGGRTSTCS